MTFESRSHSKPRIMMWDPPPPHTHTLCSFIWSHTKVKDTLLVTSGLIEQVPEQEPDICIDRSDMIDVRLYQRSNQPHEWMSGFLLFLFEGGKKEHSSRSDKNNLWEEPPLLPEYKNSKEDQMGWYLSDCNLFRPCSLGWHGDREHARTFFPLIAHKAWKIRCWDSEIPIAVEETIHLVVLWGTPGALPKCL